MEQNNSGGKKAATPPRAPLRSVPGAEPVMQVVGFRVEGQSPSPMLHGALMEAAGLEEDENSQRLVIIPPSFGVKSQLPPPSGLLLRPSCCPIIHPGASSNPGWPLIRCCCCYYSFRLCFPLPRFLSHCTPLPRMTPLRSPESPRFPSGDRGGHRGSRQPDALSGKQSGYSCSGCGSNRKHNHSHSS